MAGFRELTEVMLIERSLAAAGSILNNRVMIRQCKCNRRSSMNRKESDLRCSAKNIAGDW